MSELPTRYNPKEVESKWNKFWQSSGFFYASADKEKKPYSIVIPPPNVTGILHMGHALNNTIQDILIRKKRMSGFNAEWTPGTDHAGIATQNVVEKQLAKESKTRHDLGRKEFEKKAWQWTKEHGQTIIDQLKALGASCDWRRQRFTLDENYSEAVKSAFVKLYNDGLIYRGSYIINWCPRCKTALSDEEAPHKEVAGTLYYIKYPLKDKDEYVTVATTRPETMFGDTALAVSPGDERYKHLVGKKAILPIVKRELKIIEDEIVDPEFGTGIVKVTPLHDANDFEIGNRHKLEGILCINEDGTMNDNATEEFAGLDRFEAREALVDRLKEEGLLLKTEPHSHAVAHCYRCHTMVEPYFSQQWFVKMKPLAKKALKEAKKGQIKFYPKRWYKIYENWLMNIKDWCISRQIWWGHRIPVYYCKKCHAQYQKSLSEGSVRLPLKVQDERIGIASVGEKVDRCPYCGSTDIVQDPDVLDTWFSSWLWPQAVYGWPKDTEELSYFYPTDTLVTASEIIFFWVARMIMSGLYFMEEKPFTNVYIHGTVRDDKGRKMSKSLGNAIDPLKIIDKYGADALRFSLISLPGEDLYLSLGKFEFGRNFTNKIWNASRYILTNLDKNKIKVQDLDDIEKLISGDEYLAQRWIISKLNVLIEDLEKGYENFRFDQISNKLYDFFWHKFCDWYIEIAKVNIKDEVTQAVLYIVLKNILKLLHPLIPYITEEIWQKIPDTQTQSITVSSQPKSNKKLIKEKDEQLFEHVLETIRAVRNKRSQFKISSSVVLKKILVNTDSKTISKVIDRYSEHIKKLAKIETIEFVDSIKDKPVKSTVALIKRIEIYIPLEGLIDFEKEKRRIKKQLEKTESDLKSLEKRLENKRFLKQAPDHIIKETELRKQQQILKVENLKKNLKELNQ